METEQFLQYCNEEQGEIKRKIAELSEDAIIRLKAELNKKMVNSDKWNIWIFLCTSLFTIITLIITLATLYITSDELPGDIWKKWILDHSNTVILVSVCIWVVIVVFCCTALFNKSKYTRALCYLNEYSARRIGVINENKEDVVEEIAQTIKRHRLESQSILDEWKKKQIYAAKQVESYELYIRNMNNQLN